MVQIVPITAGIIVRGVGGIAIRAAASGLGRAAGSIAASRGGTMVLGSAGGNILVDLLGKVAEWAHNAVSGDDIENAKEATHDVQFATLDVRADPKSITGLFGVVYPDFSSVVNNRETIDTDKKDGANVSVAKPTGFWAVHINIDEFDEATLSKWQHPLKRRNFGFITFCRGGTAIMDCPIHYGNQIIPVPLVRALAEGSVGAEISGVAVNYACGHLAPSVKATLSFLPVWEVYSYGWQKDKPT